MRIITELLGLEGSSRNHVVHSPSMSLNTSFGPVISHFRHNTHFSVRLLVCPKTYGPTPVTYFSGFFFSTTSKPLTFSARRQRTQQSEPHHLGQPRPGGQRGQVWRERRARPPEPAGLRSAQAPAGPCPAAPRAGESAAVPVPVPAATPRPDRPAGPARSFPPRPRP